MDKMGDQERRRDDGPRAYGRGPSSSTKATNVDDFEFDVFLSFTFEEEEEEESRLSLNRFICSLCEALEHHRLRAFIPNRQGGKMEEVIGAIERSKVFLPIFSKLYADSTLCLTQVAKMVEFKRLMLPVFYNVEPREVRNQRGSFEAAFKKRQEDKELDQGRVESWKAALSEAGEIKGWDVRTDAETGKEQKLIPSIIKRILGYMSTVAPLELTKYPVGLHSRVKHMINLLDLEASDDVKMVGIHGIGGVGKTTIAKATCNAIASRFEATCFIQNVKDKAKQVNWLVSLQQQIITELLNDKHTTITNTSQGTKLIEQRIHSRRVLIVIDDVNDMEQLSALAGSRSWFCHGSRIIFTTRYKHLLNVHGLKEDEIYELQSLTPKESLELFSLYAFGTAKPLEEYARLSEEVASTAEGLPLTLEILGSLFFDKRGEKEWKDSLERLKKYEHNGVHGKLRISYEELDETEKHIFLDIACFLQGKGTENAIYMWRECDLFPVIGIRVLIHRSLVKIDSIFNEFRMHDQVQEMGRQIVSQENHPELRSRLWESDEISDMLQNKKGTDNVKGIVLNSREGNQTCVAAEDFATMSNLALLHINGAEILGDFRCLPKQIKWLEWEKCPLTSLPAEFSPDGAVILDLHESMISRLWNQERLETKTLGRLKVLNLRYCEKLVATPDFFSLPCLVKLLLDGCRSLVEVHQSIGCLKSLVTLSMSGCTSLEELPSSIYQLSSLKSLILEGCTRLSTFPELPDSDGTKLSENFSAKEVSYCQSDMLNPTFLNISSTCIREIPPSFSLFSKLKILNLNYTSQVTMIPSSFRHLKNLEKLGARQCKWSEHGNPSDHVVLPSVKKLDLWHCKFRSIPSWISNSFPNLRELVLEECLNLDSLPSLPSSLTKLNLIGCANLETISNVSNLVNLKELFLNGCESLLKVHGIQDLKFLRTLTMPPCCGTGSPLEKAVFEDEAFAHLKHFEGSGSLVPGWPAEEQLCFLLPKGPIIQDAEDVDFDFIMIDGHTEGSLITFEVIGKNQEVLFHASLEPHYEDAVDGVCVVLFDRDDKILHYLRTGSNRIHVTFHNPEELIGGTVSVGPFRDDEPLSFRANKSTRVLKHYYSRRFDGC